MPTPELKKGWPTGCSACATDRSGNVWLGMMYQAAIAKFDRHRTRIHDLDMPPEMQKDHGADQHGERRPQSHVDGKVWSQNNGFAASTGSTSRPGNIEYDRAVQGPPASDETHNIYDVIPDSKNNAYFTDFAAEYIGRIDAKTRRGHAVPDADATPAARAAA